MNNTVTSNPHNTISKIVVGGTAYDIASSVSFDNTGTSHTLTELLDRIEKLEQDTRFTHTVISCQNCGATINQKIDDHIVKCPYCESVYFIGKYLINS